MKFCQIVFSIASCVICLASAGKCLAESRRLRVCSQNLQRLESGKNNWRKDQNSKAADFLVSRIKTAKCDLVALQEVPGENMDLSEALLEEFIEQLENRTDRQFELILGRSNDRFIRNGFLVRADIGKVVQTKHYNREMLPDINGSRYARRSFTRGPLGILVELTNPLGGFNKLYLITMHFKSKRSNYSDPTQTDFEVQRLEAAEALRRLALKDVRSFGDDTALIVLGDRNSSTGAASVDILEGDRRLEDFTRGNCKIDADLRSECDVPAQRGPLVGLFSLRQSKFPEFSKFGSHKFRRREELLDEILVQEKVLPLVTRPDGKLALGFEGEFYKGSDHLLLWAEIAENGKGL